MCQKGSIGCGVVQYILTTSDSLLKILLKKLVDKGGRVNNRGCKGMSLGTKANSCCRGFWGRVDMERPNGPGDEKYIGIGRFTERINLGLVGLVEYTLNEVHGITTDGANNKFGDYCWDPGFI